MKKLIIAAATAALMTACASAPTQTNTLVQANAAIIAATTANGKANKVSYAWRDTGKIIKKARKAKDAGKFDAAVKLAKKAERQAVNAYTQYQEQRNAKPRY